MHIFTLRSVTVQLMAGALVIAGLLFFTAPARAAGLTEAQIQAIMSLLSSFGADQSVITNVNASLHGQATPGSTPSTPSTSSCLDLNNNLYVDVTDDASNGEVSKLQQFLGGRVTGYFGPATLQLVQNWQASHGVVSSGDPDTTGFGYVGPKTRSALGCGSNTPNTPSTPTPPVNPSTPPVTTPPVTPPPTPNNPPISAAPTCTITSSASSVTPGQQFTLSWNSTNATSASLAPAEGAVPVSGSKQISVGSTGATQTSTFYLYVYGNGGSGSCSVSVSAGFGAAPSGTIDPSSLTANAGTITLMGGASNSTSVFVALVNQNYSGPTDWYTIYSNHSYIAFSGSSISYVNNGRWSASLPNISNGTYKVLVYDNSTAQALLTSGILQVNTVSTPAGSTVSATGISGNAVTVTYSNLPVYAYINLLWHNENSQWESTGQGQVPNGGSGTITIQQDPNAPSGYYMPEARTTDNTNFSTDGTLYVFKSSNAALNCTLLASPSTITSGQQVTLSWTSLGANNAYWNQNPAASALGLPATNIMTNGSGSYTVTGGAGTVTPILMLSRNDGLSGSCSTPITVINGTSCTITASNPYDASGNQIPVTLTWSSPNATSASLATYHPYSQQTVSTTNVPTSGNTVVSPTDTTNYILNVTGPNGGGACQVQVGLKG